MQEKNRYKAIDIILAQDRKAARTIFGYVRALILGCRMLERMIVRETSEEIELENNVVISIQTASFRSVRSYTAAAVICLLTDASSWSTPS